MKTLILFFTFLFSFNAHSIHRECSKSHPRTGECQRYRHLAEESDLKVLHGKMDQILSKVKLIENRPDVTLEEIKAIKDELEDYVYMLIKKYDEVRND